MHPRVWVGRVLSTKVKDMKYQPFRELVLPKAFKVKCDEENNTEEDIEEGRVNIDIEITFERLPVTEGGEA